jgi:hypothetical protein
LDWWWIDSISFILLDEVPIVDVIELESAASEEVLEECPEVRVVGFLIEAEVPDVSEVGRQVLWESLTQRLDGGGDLLLHDALVLVLLVRGLEVLPRELSLQEVHHHIPHGF